MALSIESKLRKVLNSNDENKIHEIFEEIYNEYSKLVFVIINNYVKNIHDSEELVQDTFVSFFNSLNKKEILNIKYYLLVIAKNKALDFIKLNKRNLQIYEDVIYDSLDDTDISFFIDVFYDLKKYLNDFEIELVINHIVYNFSFKELSIKYNQKINTLITTYNRAIKKYKKGVHNEKNN